MLRSALLLATGVAAGGCAQIFGIDKTSAGGDAGNANASLEIQHVSTGVAVARNPLDITGLTASYLTPDRVPAAQIAIDTWSADVTGTPPIEFVLPDEPTPIPRIYAFPARTLLGIFDQLADVDAQPAPAGATFALDVTLDHAYAAAESIDIYTVGAWSQYTLTAAEVPVVGALAVAPPPIAYTAFNAVGDALHAMTAADAVFVVEHSGGLLTDVAAIAAFDQVAGSNAITGTMVAVPADGSASATIDPTATAARYPAIAPVVGTPTMSWQVTAAPGASVARAAGPSLATGAVAAADASIAATYGNPFAAMSWPAVLTCSTSASRTYALPGATAPVTLSAGLSQTDVAASGLAFDLAVGLPTMTTLDQTALTIDGMTVAIDTTQPATIAITTDLAAATFYRVTLFELTASADGAAVVETPKLIADGLASTFAVPADYFVGGHTYVIRAAAFVGGAPMAATGNLQDRALPITTGFADSAVFTIAP